jgi:MFS family permease
MPPATARPDAEPENRGTGWYGAAVGSWFGAFGMQSVVFSWLLVGELRVEAQWVGIAQTASAVPQLALLLVGGAVADRLEPRRMLAGMHVASALPALVLAIVVLSGNLTLASVIGFGVAVGAVNAFLMPARDTLLSRVAGSNMVRAVTAMTVVQFASQLAGTLIGGTAEHVGSGTVLIAQSLLLLAGMFFALRLPGPNRAETAKQSGAQLITDGIREVWGQPALRAVLVLVACVGLFFIGPFLVVFPLLVRNFYGGGAQDLAIVLMLFPLGTILGSIGLRAYGGVRRKVRATMIALLSGAILILCIGLGPSWWAYLGLTLCWGLAGAFFINLSRSVFQETASERNRARVLAVYQLGLMGGSPIGSLTSGFLSGAFSPHAALLIAGSAMIAVVSWVWLTTEAAALD